MQKARETFIVIASVKFHCLSGGSLLFEKKIPALIQCFDVVSQVSLLHNGSVVISAFSSDAIK